MTEYGFPRASGEVIPVRTELADLVVQELRRAGLPAFREGGSDGPDRSGAVVYVDPDTEFGRMSDLLPALRPTFVRPGA
ncbi:hypothetical protein [Streptomyces sp. NPDC004284]|uniref:hypothetical protein n=1 Tax=Streptomyces sp. NPDC004284 TaxID=3364695 RepID=UPI0036A19387